MISVCMATYNGEQFISEQISSILAQLSSGDELVISDDCSSDETIAIVKSFSDPRIKIFENRDRVGYSANFQRCLEKCDGDIIFLSDQDDVWFPNKVVRCLEEIKKSDLLVHNCLLVDGHLKGEGLDYFTLKKVRRGFLYNLLSIRYLGCCMVFKKRLLGAALPIPIKEGVITHDSWITLISELKYKTTLLDEPLMYYRRHGNNTSNGGSSEMNSIFKIAYIRAYTIISLIVSTLKVN